MECPKLYAELKRFCEGKFAATEKRDARAEDKEIADAFNAQSVRRFRPLSAGEFFDALTSDQIAQWQASKNADAAAVWLYAQAGVAIDASNGTPTRKRLNAMDDIPELKPLVTAVKQAADVGQPQWEKDDCERPAHHGDVAFVRKQAAKEALRNV